MATGLIPLRRPEPPQVDGLVPVLLLLASALVLVATLAARHWYLQSDLQGLALALVVTSVACLVLVVVHYRRHFWALAPLLLLLIVVFHVGLFVGPVVTGRFQLLAASSDAWTTTTEMRQAAWYVAACLSAYALGANLARVIGGPERIHELTDDGFARAVAQVGSVMLAVSVIAWFAIVISLFGLGAFQVSYLDFFAATRSTVVADANLGIALGLVLACVSPASRSARIALVFFGMFAVASLFIGARSTTMFAAAAALVVLAYRRTMPRAALMAPIVAGVLTVLGIVRLTRLRGLAEVQVSDLLHAPLTGLAEMGSTIRVVQTSFLWHGVMHEPISWGTTYLGWPARLIQRFLLGQALPPEDFRLMNVEIGSRVGGLGGSILAEAHHNFGVAGGVLLTLGVGVFAACVSRSVRTTTQLALLGVVTVPLFVHVRNSFAPFLFTLICGLLLVAVARLIQSRREQ